MTTTHSSMYRVGPLRALLLPLFRRLNPGDVTIRHHWTGDPLRLHSFRHKGYWFHGRNREVEELRWIGELLRPGQTAFDVGGHIGYMSLYFSHLVANIGTVVTFEPGSNNLPYLRANIATARHQNIRLVESAVSASTGNLSFCLEDLTGQNNSLVLDYQVLDQNVQSAHVKAERSIVTVPATTIDEFCLQNNASPSFVKIDVEGAETDVLQGMQQTLRLARPAIMIEVTRNKQAVWDLFAAARYSLFTPQRTAVAGPSQMQSANLFAIPI